MKTLNIHEAKTHFSKFVDAAMQGEEIIIAKAEKRPFVGSVSSLLFFSFFRNGHPALDAQSINGRDVLQKEKNNKLETPPLCLIIYFYL